MGCKCFYRTQKKEFQGGWALTMWDVNINYYAERFKFWTSWALTMWDVN